MCTSRQGFDAPSRHRLAALLCAKSVRTGDFKLSAGARASAYVDVKKTALSGCGAELLGRALWKLARQASPTAEAVGGLTLGADPLLTAITLAAWQHSGHDLSAIIVRKEAKGHGTRQFLERPDPPNFDLSGARHEVIAVDDVITTGASTLLAIERMRAAGLTVRHAICVVDREESGANQLAVAGVALHRLFTLSELLKFREQD